MISNTDLGTISKISGSAVETGKVTYYCNAYNTIELSKPTIEDQDTGSSTVEGEK